jgi:hypothetical protein
MPSCGLIYTLIKMTNVVVQDPDHFFYIQNTSVHNRALSLFINIKS